MSEKLASTSGSRGLELSDRFLPDWVHQMRNPLFGLQAVLDGLEADCGQDESRRSFVSLGQGQLLRLKRMADDLLAYGAPPPFSPARLRIARVVQDAVDEVRESAVAKEVAIQEASGDDDATCVADHSRLVLALAHLVLNAVRRSPAGGRVDVRPTLVPRDGASWQAFVVEDEGAVLDDAARATAFEPFAVRSGERTGLELAIVKAVALQHGGHALVEARNGGGLTFSLLLPEATNA